jgi:hypothetical protein
MGTSAGPSLQGIGRGGDSNLVLEMDAHDAKSYPGEPTTNIFYNPNNWTGSDWTSSSGTIANNAAEGPNGGSAGSITATNSDPYIYSGAVHSVATGSLTFSCWVKGVGSSVGKSGDMRINFGPGTATGSDPTYVDYTLTDQWQRVSILATVTGAGTIQVGLEPPNSAAVGDVVYLADAQLEQKGYATPFVREGKGGTGTYNARPATTNLMIHGNVGTGQTFSDSSPSKHTITANGNTTHSGTQSKFNGGSIYFDGTGDYLNVADSTDWEFSNGVFTIDFWYKNNSTANNRGVISIASSSQSNYESILVYTGGSATTLVLYSSSGGTIWDIASAAAMGAFGSDWTHYAIVRESVAGDIKLYNNGTLIDVVSTSATLRAVDTFRIGQRVSESNGASCYLDEIRITKGTALWTAAFTPPTRRNLSAPVVDRSGNHNGANLINGTDTDTATYRVGEVIRPIDSAFWDFDGTDEHLTTPFGSGRNVYTNPISVCAWIKTDLTAPNKMWLDVGSNGTNQRFYCALIDANSPNNFGIQGQAWGYGATSDTTKWYHQAIVMDNGTARAYYDGIAGGTKGFSSYTLPSNIIIGGRGGYEWNGQIAAVQIYDTILTPQQVKENFNQQRSRFKI